MYEGFFMTKIFHPNVSEQGEICVNTLKKDWQPTLGLDHVLMVHFFSGHVCDISTLSYSHCAQVIRCLLIVPNAESALNPEAGRLLLDDYEDFVQRAKLSTKIHAQPRKVEHFSVAASAIPAPAVAVSASSASGSHAGTAKAAAMPAAVVKPKIVAQKPTAAKSSLRRL